MRTPDDDGRGWLGGWARGGGAGVRAPDGDRERRVEVVASGRKPKKGEFCVRDCVMDNTVKYANIEKQIP